MALVHPRREATLTGFHSARCSVWRLDRAGTQALVTNVPAAYRPATGTRQGGGGDTWGDERPSGERIRLSGWHPQIYSPAFASLTLADGSVLQFEVGEVHPDGPGPEGTLLLVTVRGR